MQVEEKAALAVLWNGSFQARFLNCSPDQLLTCSAGESRLPRISFADRWPASLVERVPSALFQAADQLWKSA